MLDLKKLSAVLITATLLVNHAYADTVPTAASTSSAQAAADDQTIELPNNLRIVPTQQHEESAELLYHIDANYPQITGEQLSPAAQKFNATVKALVQQNMQQFINYVKSDQPHMQTLPVEVRQNSLDIDYDIDVVTPGNHSILSLRLNIEGMQAGRAHPYHMHEILNYDLTDNKILALSDLFKPRAKYLNALAKFSQTKLNTTLEDKWMIKEGTQPVAKNFKIWNVEADGILITFDEYQVAPYVYGAQEVVVPYSALKSLLVKNSFLMPCVVDAHSCGADK